MILLLAKNNTHIVWVQTATDLKLKMKWRERKRIPIHERSRDNVLMTILAAFSDWNNSFLLCHFIKMCAHTSFNKQLLARSLLLLRQTDIRKKTWFIVNLCLYHDKNYSPIYTCTQYLIYNNEIWLNVCDKFTVQITHFLILSSNSLYEKKGQLVLKIDSISIALCVFLLSFSLFIFFH